MSCPFLRQKYCVARMNSRGGRPQGPRLSYNFRRIGRHKGYWPQSWMHRANRWPLNRTGTSGGARRRASGGARRRVLGCSVAGVSEPCRSSNGRANMRAGARCIDCVRVSSRTAIGGPDHLAAPSSRATRRHFGGASISVRNSPRWAFFPLLDVATLIFTSLFTPAGALRCLKLKHHTSHLTMSKHLLQPLKTIKMFKQVFVTLWHPIMVQIHRILPVIAKLSVIDLT
jgi:hypothetical protein